MPKITLTPDGLREEAGKVTTCMEEQRQVIDNVARVIDEIVSDWEGDAQAGFIEAFERVRPTYEKFAPDLSNFATYLNDYSNSMEFIDLGGGSRIRGAGA